MRSGEILPPDILEAFVDPPFGAPKEPAFVADPTLSQRARKDRAPDKMFFELDGTRHPAGQ